ncbi:GerAB/ArcD/ProY family transporter [Cytobacillus suaedae]|nr:GerAB/ArcD/ProY family transporter [Cytobacillus suaedae]
MNRYFYYLIILNMMVNVFLYVPNILLQERFEGAVMGIFLGLLIGCILLFTFTASINKFVGSGVLELFASVPKWFRLLFLGFFSIMWFSAGAISLLAFNNVTIRFVNPDASGINMITVFAIFIILLLVRLKSNSLLFTMELVFIINIPLVLTIMFQAYTKDYISWDSIREVGTHFWEMPSWSVLAAATFVFSGYTNMVIFNSVIKEKITLKRLWFVPILGAINLFTSFCIPIGFWGADGVGDLTFPWVATADSLRIENGPIERVVTLFIFLYVGISMISVAVHWHVAFEIIKSITKIKSEKKKKVFNWLILASFFIGILLLEHNLREKDIFTFGQLWLNVRLPSEMILVLFMFFLARRKKV